MIARRSRSIGSMFRNHAHPAFLTKLRTFVAFFGAVQVGAVQAKNAKNILIKNVFDASLGASEWT